MKRDPRLSGLSSEHHQALVIARTIARRASHGRADGDTARWLAERFAAELEPHFRVEEDVLLPALRAIGELELASRVANDHARLREAVAAASAGALEALPEFAARLEEHVRFEERVLFPRCEAILSGSTLDEVRRRCPH